MASKHSTYCLTCEQTVGVRVTAFNKSPAKATPKVVPHKNKSGLKCPASNVSVHPNQVMAAL